MKLKLQIAIVLFFCLLAVPIYPALSIAPGIQSQAVSVPNGAVRLWSNLPQNTANAPRQGSVPPLGYEIDIAEMTKLKEQPYVSSDSLPTAVMDKADSSQPQASAPNLLTNFEGPDDLNQPGGFLVRPPDPHIASGPSHVVVMVNSEIVVYTKAGVQVSETSLNDWWSDVYTGTELIFDPRIAYDQAEGHWIMLAVIIETQPTAWYALSVSQTSDPTGAWWNWLLDGGWSIFGANTWADYPDLGYDGIPSASGGAVYVTSNQFTWLGLFKSSLINTLPKSALYAGLGFSYYVQWGLTNSDGSQAFTLRAAHTYGNPGREFLINSKSGGWNRVMVRAGKPSFPPNPAPSWRSGALTIGAYSPPPPAKQLGTAATLDTIDNRMYNFIYQGGYLFAAFTEAYNWGTPGNTEAVIRVIRINIAARSVDINERYGADNSYYWFPAITTDASSNIHLVFARSSTAEYAGIRFTGRLTTDIALQPSALLKAGATIITGSRWGDYFGVSRDPAEPTKVWIFGEWAKDCAGVSSDWDWGTWIGQTSF